MLRGPKRFRKPLMQNAGEALAFLGGVGGDKESEFIAPNSAENVLGPKHRQGPLAKNMQHGVTRCVSVNVVQCLEIIEIEDRKYQRVPAARD